MRSAQGRATVAFVSVPGLAYDVVDSILHDLRSQALHKHAMVRFVREFPARVVPPIRRAQGRAALALVGRCDGLPEVPLDVIDAVLLHLRRATVPLSVLAAYNRWLRKKCGAVPDVMV